MRTFFIIFLIFSSSVCSFGQCIWGDCANGFGEYRRGTTAQSFFKNNLPLGIARMNDNKGWHYIYIGAQTNERMALVVSKERYYLFLMDSNHKAMHPLIAFNTINLNTEELKNEDLSLQRIPRYNGNKAGCIAGDCKNGYGEFRFGDGSDFRGLYVNGVARGGLIIYPKGFYIGEVGPFGTKREGVGYMGIDKWVYFGQFQNNDYEGQGFELIDGNLLQGGIYAKGQLVKKQIDRAK